MQQIVSRLQLPLWLSLAVLAAFPLFELTFYTELLTKIMIMAIFAMSLDLLVGYTGLVSLGHAAFFGLAGYTLALIAPQYEAANLWLTLGVAILVSALAALVIGLFVLRTKGVYFIMVTLAFAQMFYFVFHDTDLGGGSDGLFLYFKPDAAIAGFKPFDLENTLHFYYFVLISLVVSYFLLCRILRSPFGHALVGIKTNEHRMQSLGYPVFYYKLASFAIGGSLAGFAGYLSACQYGFVNPEILSWHQSGSVLLMVILGGQGAFYGAAIGAFVFVLLQEFLSSLTKHWQLFMGVIIVLLVLYLPGGLRSIGPLLRASLLGKTANVKPPAGNDPPDIAQEESANDRSDSLH
ncbi:MAG: branched-chain amino acid ABC transporter permease [Gammaproteobacteria bacterium]|nr:branched-chain amino acid ABC transporter permease [Gammaproteobacteria bacterium]MCP5458390.1 branched-chain amino acid ABC transporter permease [Gammaproteobacteria bacterium]